MVKVSIDTIPIYCINLLTSVERWNRVYDRCRQEKLFVQRWIADTPENILADGNYAHYLTPTQKACASSHLRLWRFFVNNTEHDAIMILEDDAIFLKGWRPNIESFLSEHETQDWDAVFLHVSEPIEPLYTWTRVTNQCLTAGYILSRGGARFLVDRFREEYFASDCMTQDLQNQGKCFSFFPWLIIQDGTPSTIQQNNGADVDKVIRVLGQYGMSLSDYI